MEGASISNREELYQQVWSEPITTLAMRYGLSGVGFAKRCRRAGVPIPGRGHWAAVKAGKRVRIPDLPKVRPGQEPMRILVARDSAELLATSQMKQIRQSIKESVRVGELPPIGRETHVLARAAHKRLSIRDGWADARGLRSAPGEVVAIEVTKESVDRACRLAGVLFTELERQGVSVCLDKESKSSVLDVGGIQLKITITEHLCRSKHERTKAEQRAMDRWNDSFRYPAVSLEYPSVPEYDFSPTGLLTISVGKYPQRNWRDSTKRRLESRLGVVVSEILLLADDIRTAEQQRARREQECKEQREAYQQALELWQGERDAVRQLVRDARKWESALQVRRFIDALNVSGAPAPGRGDMQAWLDWARKKADWLDPLINVEDEILDSPEPERPKNYW